MHHHAAVQLETFDVEFVQQLDAAGSDQRGQPGAEVSTRRQGIFAAAAITGLLTADGPIDPGCGHVLGQTSEVEQRVHRRMTGSYHQHPFAGITLPLRAEHIGDAIGDWSQSLASCRQTGSSGRARFRPGPTRVDHRLGFDLHFLPVRLHDCHQKWPLAPPGRFDLVETTPRHTNDPCSQPKVRRQPWSCGQRLEILFDQLVAGREILRLGRGPAVGGQEPGPCLGEVEAPGGKHPHVPPLPDIGTNLRPRFDDQRPNAPQQQLRGRGQTYRPGTDDDHRQIATRTSGNGWAVGQQFRRTRDRGGRPGVAAAARRSMGDRFHGRAP